MAAPNHELSPEELNELLSGLMPDIPGYQVMRRIGRGGMCYVYLGLQKSLDRQVAIKVMAPDALNDEVSKQRFEREARTIAKLEHPCIVGIHEVGRTEEGLLFYVLPYLSKGHVGKRDLTHDEPRVIEVLRAMLSALDYAHARGIVHRDVKAENVLFDNADRPVLTDFGIAVSKRDNFRMTGGGMALGSSGYMSPEQARGERVDGRADIYSLGVLGFEMLCGHLPFQNADLLGLALMHAQDPVPRLPHGKGHWQAFIDKAMAKSARDRYATVQQMMQALDQVEAASIALRRDAPAHAPTRTLPLPSPTMPARRPRAWLAALSTRLQPLGSDGRRFLVAASLALGVLVVSGLLWSVLDKPSAQTNLDTAGAALTGTPAAPETIPAPGAPTPAPDGQGQESPLASDAAQIESVDAPAAAATEPVPELAPGERELAAAREQIARGRLSLPPGNNAFDSLFAAQRIRPRSTQLPILGERWITAATPHLLGALAEGREAVALALLQRADTLAEAFQLREASAWQQLQQSLAGVMSGRLQAALQAADVQALRAAKAQATRFGVAATALEPAWSAAIVVAKPGDRLPSGSSDVVLVRLPSRNGAGLAAMTREVTRAEYAAFVASTGRSATRCRNRSAGLFQRKRTWQQPGFDQAGDHPVVCVSGADALAYAEWLSVRDGVRYRLPSAAEWSRMANYPVAGEACAADRLACGANGTAPTTQGSASPLGLRGLRGNTREWLSDCSDGCRKRHAGGLGWRDAPVASAAGSEALEGELAFDDVGFRLLREVAAAEVEIR